MKNPDCRIKAQPEQILHLQKILALFARKMQHGWMISQPPSSEHLDLFSLKRGVTPAQIMQEIVSLAPIHPVCARAVIVLTAQKLKYPNIKFAFDSDH